MLYSLDPGNFVPELALPFERPLIFSAGAGITSQTVKAMAVLGTGEHKRMSQVETWNYTVFPSNTSDSLQPGQARDLTQGMSMANKGSSAVFAKLGSFDQLGQPGFKDATHSVTLSAGAGQLVPHAAFIRATGQTQAVYRVVSGRVEYVGAGARWRCGCGSVFRGGGFPGAVLDPGRADRYDGGFHAGDPHAKGQRGQPLLQGHRLRAGGGRRALPPDADGSLVFHVKNAKGEMKNLWFKASAGDACEPEPAAGRRGQVLRPAGLGEAEIAADLEAGQFGTAL